MALRGVDEDIAAHNQGRLVSEFPDRILVRGGETRHGRARGAARRLLPDVLGSEGRREQFRPRIRTTP
jgi:hypothetical protein